MPSIITSVWPVLAPRSRMFVVEPGPPLSEMSRPGTVLKASTSEPGLLVASVSPLTTLIELPVRLIGSGSLSAVTTISGGGAGGAAGVLLTAGRTGPALRRSLVSANLTGRFGLEHSD